MTPQFSNQVLIFHDNTGFCLTIYELHRVTKKKWNEAATDLCPCGEKQTMSHTVDSCPLTKLNGGLSQVHSADDEAVALLISDGS